MTIIALAAQQTAILVLKTSRYSGQTILLVLKTNNSDDNDCAAAEETEILVLKTEVLVRFSADTTKARRNTKPGRSHCAAAEEICAAAEETRDRRKNLTPVLRPNNTAPHFPDKTTSVAMNVLPEINLIDIILRIFLKFSGNVA